MSAVDVIRRRVKPYTLTRLVVPTIVDGISTPGTPVVSTIDAYQQPMTAKELRNLPQGQNSGEWRNIWTEAFLKLTDTITIGAIIFTIQRVTLWEDGPFYICNANHTGDVIT